MYCMRHFLIARRKGEIQQRGLVCAGLPNLIVVGKRQTARDHISEEVSHPDGQIWIDSLHHL